MASTQSGHAALAVVTGASSGMGAEIARELFRRGRPVLAVARRADRLEALAAEARKGGHATVHTLALDVTAPGAAERIRDRARQLGGLAWLVNDAGFGLYGPFVEAEPRRLGEMVRLNCETVVVLSRTLLPDIVKAGKDGVLLNVASLGAMQPMPYMAVYGATKAFVLSFTEALAEELRDTGVTVSAFCPGPVNTEFGGVAGTAVRFKDTPSIDAPQAAREGLDGVARRDVVVLSGPWTNQFAALGRYLPRGVHRWMARKILEPWGKA